VFTSVRIDVGKALLRGLGHHAFDNRRIQSFVIV
jgi:hypothetical protein